MKKLFVVIMLIAGCGYSARNNEMMGQVKKVHHNTPIICRDYDSADVSLGVMRNGVGSMSTQDVEITIQSNEQLQLLQQATKSGKLVKITYDERRLTLCRPEIKVISVEEIE